MPKSPIDRAVGHEGHRLNCAYKHCELYHFEFSTWRERADHEWKAHRNNPNKRKYVRKDKV